MNNVLDKNTLIKSDIRVVIDSSYPLKKGTYRRLSDNEKFTAYIISGNISTDKELIMKHDRKYRSFKFYPISNKMYLLDSATYNIRQIIIPGDILLVGISLEIIRIEDLYDKTKFVSI